MNPSDEKEKFIDHGQGDLRATWIQSLVTFFWPLVFFLGIRWLLIEPFVIPSGSMIPNLLIHDHIFVNKMAYGLQNPFKERLAYLWGEATNQGVVSSMVMIIILDYFLTNVFIRIFYAITGI